jgi:subtilisin family serine protease
MSYSLPLFIFAFCSLFSSSSLFSVQTFASPKFRSNAQPSFVQGQALVKVDSKQSTGGLLALQDKIKAKAIHNFSIVPDLYLYQFDPSADVLEVVRQFKAHKVVVYAEPNYIYRTAVEEVNDPDFAKLWGLENNSQTGGKIDADINALPMWNLQRGSKNIVIGITDTGMDYTHPDLLANVWTNPGEIKDNGKDDDQNGYVDDIHGVNAIKKNGNPMDDNVHGTHVAGTIGAVGNNGQGISGVAQNIQMIPCKFLSSRGAGTTSDALKCLEYFAVLKSRPYNPVNIVATNNSWGGGGRSQALLDAIKAHEKLGILFVAAAGNDSANNDVTDSYPANYDVGNIVSVAATDHNDRLATFSNYGRKKVHIAAPGVKIWSTTLGHSYGELSGTSMATPHVTGLIAIIASQFNSLSFQGIKNLLLAGGQKIAATTNTTISGRRIRGADDNGVGSLTCNNQILVVRNEPTTSTHNIQLGQSIRLSAQHFNCASAAGPLLVYQGLNEQVVLEDNGENGDLIANDGIYSLNWTPALAGDYQLKFSDDDLVDIRVFDRGDSRSHVANERVAL